MLKNIVSTLGTKSITTIISFLIVVLTSNLLGAETIGNVSLLILGITIVLLFSNFVGGGALIYLIPRNQATRLIFISYIWAIISCFIISFILFSFNLIPRQFAYHVFFLSLVNSLAAIHLNVLIAREKIKLYNIITLVQVIIQILFYVILLFAVKIVNINSYIYSLYIAYIFTFIASLLLISKEIKITKLSKLDYEIRQVFKYGSYVQFSNIIQLLNYRLSYFIIDYYYGKSLLGVFALSIQISETLWLISRSIALVQYARISNAKDELLSKNITISFVKIVFITIIVSIVPLLLMPSAVFTFIFGKDFSLVNHVILFMSLGIIAVAINMILSHFFSGTGRHYFNTIGSAIGLFVTLITGIILIPFLGLTGAAITASLSYLSSLVFQMLVFNNITKTSLKQYIPLKQDFITFYKLIKGTKFK